MHVNTFDGSPYLSLRLNSSSMFKLLGIPYQTNLGYGKCNYVVQRRVGHATSERFGPNIYNIIQLNCAINGILTQNHSIYILGQFFCFLETPLCFSMKPIKQLPKLCGNQFYLQDLELDLDGCNYVPITMEISAITTYITGN